MAEKVQQSIEEMLPELEQITRVGLFSFNETKQILRRRKKFEYRMQRKIKVKEDYIQYIQYEINFLNLLKKRRKRIGYYFKKREIEDAVVQRIHKLFRIATVRFQDDVNIWLSHINFSKSQKERSSMSKLFTRMLQVHSKKPELWALQAKWEFEDNLNPENARNVFQRGIRFNEHSLQLWKEYFRMELMYAEKMRKRKQLLESAGMPEDEEEVSEAVLNGDVAKLVYLKAKETFPDEITIPLKFCQVCDMFNFMEDLSREITSDLRTRFSNSPLMWSALADKHLNAAAADEASFDTVKSELEKFHEVFQEGLKVVPGEEIWDLYLTRCLQTFSLPGPKSTKEERIELAINLFENACKTGNLSANQFGEWVKVLCKVGLVSEAKHACAEACKKYPACDWLWLKRIQILIQSGSKQQEVLAMFDNACKNVPKKETSKLWTIVLDFCMSVECKDIEDLFEKSLKFPKNVTCVTKQLYLQWTFFNKGVEMTRQLYDRFQKERPVIYELLHLYIQMEQSLAKPKLQLMRKAFENATLDLAATHPDMWLDYIKMELNYNKANPENMGKIYHRAIKSLSGELNQKFITQYTLLNTGFDV